MREMLQSESTTTRVSTGGNYCRILGFLQEGATIGEGFSSKMAEVVAGTLVDYSADSLLEGEIFIQHLGPSINDLIGWVC
jgi:hypothetical protein